MTISTIIIAVGTAILAITAIITLLIKNMPLLKEWTMRLNDKNERKRRKNLKKKITRAELQDEIETRITRAELLNATNRISKMMSLTLVVLIQIRDGLDEAEPNINETISGASQSQLDSLNQSINELNEAMEEFNDCMKEHMKKLKREYGFDDRN